MPTYTPAVAALGYDSKAIPTIGQAQVFPLPVASSAWLSQGSTNTNSAESGASSSFSSFTTAQFAAHPYKLDNYLGFTQADMVVSMQTVAGTGGGTAGIFMGLYATTTTHATTTGSTPTTSGTCLSRVWTAQANIKMTQNSVTAQTYTIWWGGPGDTSNTSTTGGNISTDCTGAMQVILFKDSNGTTLPAGNYILVHGMTSRSTVAAVMSQAGQFLVSQSQSTLGSRYFATVAFDAYAPGMGSFTSANTTYKTDASGDSQGYTGLVPFPATFAQSIISATSSADQRIAAPYFY